MQQFKKWNNLSGWIAFAIALFTYASTVEPTASFWDCGEFIATAYKLQIGHPPGAPFFMILGRLATLFAFGDVTKVALMMNLLSALMSALTILFLFWTITHMGRKIVLHKQQDLSTANVIAILGAGFVGSLAYTFSDTFWFSAVEGEVYATSSMFTALVFWAMLKWEDVADQPHADRWIVLIAYLMGISIGIHLLNLLTIPALAFIYYFRKNHGNISRKGILLTLLAGGALLGFIQFLFIPGVVGIAAKMELLFNLSLGAPIGTGAIVYTLLLIAGLVYAIIYTHRHGKVLLNTVILCVLTMLIGYASYGMILIRSSADTPMDENNPENVFTLLSYLNREQYGTRPLIYGQYFNAKVIRYDDGPKVYAPDPTTGKYIVVSDGKGTIPVFDPKYMTIFPRMWSSQANHVRGYRKWADIKGSKDRKPSFGENLRFFATYQLGFMYMRYFMWNFAGRQNDIQGHGGIADGNWKSGIGFIDNARLGTQHDLPQLLQNKANNKFYFLPLILGLIGMFFHFEKHRQDATIVALFFIMTGIAIIFFLNQYTNEPRERDYGFAGSFYAFSIYIGLAVMAMQQWLRKLAPSTVSASVAAALGLLAAPVLMAKEGWDDHDRSHRYTARDYAANYLNSCAQNAILFTNGDNDTFPLWYAQEVEGIRTDVRVVNLSLLNTDWYIDQIKRQAYDSEPVPINMEWSQYRQGVRDQVMFYDRGLKGHTNLAELMAFVKDDSPANKLPLQNGGKIEYFPTNKFRLPVDSEAVKRHQVVPVELEDRIVDALEWTIDRQYLLKADLMILEILNANNWKRPIYWAITVGSDSYLGLQDYFQLEGLAFRLVPVKNNPSPTGEDGRVQSNIMYHNLMNRFAWGNIDKAAVYMDENNLRMTMNLRNNFDRLADQLLRENKKDSVLKVLDRCFEVLPEKNVPFNFFVVPLADKYYQAGAPEQGDAIVERYANLLQEELEYYFRQKTSIFKKFDNTIQRQMYIYRRVFDLTRRHNRNELRNKLEPSFKSIDERFAANFGREDRFGQ